MNIYLTEQCAPPPLFTGTSEFGQRPKEGKKRRNLRERGISRALNASSCLFVGKLKPGFNDGHELREPKASWPLDHDLV